MTGPQTFRKRIVMTQSVVLDVEVQAESSSEADVHAFNAARAGDYDQEADAVAGQGDGWQLSHVENADD